MVHAMSHVLILLFSATLSVARRPTVYMAHELGTTEEKATDKPLRIWSLAEDMTKGRKEVDW
jgi:hypothetical protein